MEKAEEILKNVTFRSLREGDTLEMCRYINKLSKEDTYITFSGEIISLSEETEYVKKTLQLIMSHDQVKLVAELNGEIIGESTIERDITGRKRARHRGVFGVTVDKKFRRIGVGEKLITRIISEAQEWIKDLKIITLHVYESNIHAIKLYKKLGFVEYGRLPKGIFYKGKYMSEISMFKEIK